MHRIICLIVVVVMFSCSVQKKMSDTGEGINSTDLLRNIAILAADSFLGRKPFTEGETRTVEFL